MRKLWAMHPQTARNKTPFRRVATLDPGLPVSVVVGIKYLLIGEGDCVGVDVGVSRGEGQAPHGVGCVRRDSRTDPSDESGVVEVAPNGVVADGNVVDLEERGSYQSGGGVPRLAGGIDSLCQSQDEGAAAGKLGCSSAYWGSADGVDEPVVDGGE
jgi:hypothetical protein